MKKTIIVNYEYQAEGRIVFEVPDDFKVRAKTSSELFEYLKKKLPHEDLDIEKFGWQYNDDEDYSSQAVTNIEILDYEKGKMENYYPTHREKMKIR